MIHYTPLGEIVFYILLFAVAAAAAWFGLYGPDGGGDD